MSDADRRERAARALAAALNIGANEDELGVGRAYAEAALDYLEDHPSRRAALLYWLEGLALLRDQPV
jgi:hypothetical protein